MSNQGYCRTQGNLLYQPQPLDLTPEAPFLIPFPPIQLLIKDYAAGNDFLQVWTNLCYRECFCKTICWQDLHFEFSRQNLNKNVQSPSMW